MMALLPLLKILAMLAIGMLALLYATYLHFAAVMNLMRVREANELTVAAKVLGYPMLYIGLVLDFLFNITWGSLLFLELPKELLFSGRVTRLVATDKEWRGRLALWARQQLLDNVDPHGVHNG